MTMMLVVEMMRMMRMKATLGVGGWREARPGRSPAVTTLARVGQFKLGLRRGGKLSHRFECQPASGWW